MNNIASNIVYSARGDEVTDVLVNGIQIIEDKNVKSMDEEKIIIDAQRVAVEISNGAAQNFLDGDGWLAREVKNFFTLRARIIGHGYRVKMCLQTRNHA
jgi:hypothetical protein